MKTLFEQLSPENQEKVQNFKNIDLMDSLHTKTYFHQLSARDLMMLVDIFEVNRYDVSFAKAMLTILESFKQ